MKQLLTQALDLAYHKLITSLPTTTLKYEYLYLSDVHPLKLLDFIQEYHIPDTCFFTTDDGLPSIRWELSPITPSELEQLKISKFQQIAFNEVNSLLTQHHYTRIPPDHSLSKSFDHPPIYSLYLLKDYDRLVQYYSLFFVPNIP